eukprot:TRINITY_DN69596_c0_g1_i1.p1 TRINITY_DN69596_c0_g1~~TRINITY_DN69596_c0_g1_i1.p1  ORF type:complete len:295 (-),score=30.67 TRINITY_DN69596_c0_g1_i1:80-964(-)
MPSPSLCFVLASIVCGCLAVSPIPSFSDGVRLNIHLTLESSVAARAVAANRWITTHGAPHNDIDLINTSFPHVSLYLTSFVDAAPVIARIRALLEAYPHSLVPALSLSGSLPAAASKHYATNPCTASPPVFTHAHVNVSGAYAMWDVAASRCVRYLCDSIVNVTHTLITPNQTIPGWVQKLPEPERSAKVHMIRDYGSPNVFDQFFPHITVAFDDTTALPFALPAQGTRAHPGRAAADNLTAAVSSLPAGLLDATRFYAPAVSVSLVGPHGTVPRDGVLWSMPLPLPPAPAASP